MKIEARLAKAKIFMIKENLRSHWNNLVRYAIIQKKLLLWYVHLSKHFKSCKIDLL